MQSYFNVEINVFSTNDAGRMCPHSKKILENIIKTNLLRKMPDPKGYLLKEFIHITCIKKSIQIGNKSVITRGLGIGE